MQGLFLFRKICYFYKKPNMKILVLIRHAKSSWDYPSEDKNRPLLKRGEEAIAKVAEMTKQFVSNEFTIWSSNAVRAKNKAILYCNAAELDVSKIIFKDELYTFNENELERQIKKCDNSIEKLILFGHNEAITNFVNKFGDKYVFNVPTAGFVYLELDSNDWSAIKNGKTIQTIFPKEIE